MTYKDKDKQREADRERQRRYRAERGLKAYPGRDKIEAEGVTNSGRDGQGVTEGYIGAVPCAPPILEPNLKRGKDIKCFSDLHPGIQQTIDKMSMVDGKVDKTIKANRTAIAIHYQHLFPGRYYPQDTVILGPAIRGKPGDADYNGVCTEAWRAERGR